MKRIFLLTILTVLSTTVFARKQKYTDPTHQLQVSYEHLTLLPSKKNLSGIQVGYEHLKPWSFYTGVDLLSTRGPRNEEALTNLDFRFGATIAADDSTLTPFVGGGFLETVGNENHFYLSAGLRSMVALNFAFSFGLNIKALAAEEFDQIANRIHAKSLSSIPWGGSIGLPMRWIFNESATCLFQIEPSYSQLPLSGYQNIFGTKIQIAAHF